ncbi:ABC transporter ATP-binding protein [Cypionkella sp.]|uniref:ABC transporter ATP-binding protein n=1 Tax=Cypionkella sp. TaxID=2811411 RepID=UPI002ABA50AE|nr:ATP-binding cassette domain-containing protein [Cypionkella sp.]MDZ4392514.1 ATP-binding cassette domain-containing protein [Cypionkella sp.]
MHSDTVAPCPSAAIDVTAAVVTFGTFRALDGISVVVPTGSCFGIVGESGSGKTTLLRSILGLQRLSAGQVTLMGAVQPPARRDFHSLITTIQPIFQDPAQSLSPRRRIGQSMDEVAGCLGESRDEIRARLAEILQRLGLPPGVVDLYPHQISGGQARRAAIARALLFRPRILAADEPTAGLDVSVQGDLLNLLQEIRTETAVTLLVVSHNLAVVRLIADQVAVMHRGRIVEQGDCTIVLQTPLADYTQQLLASWPRARHVGDGRG